MALDPFWDTPGEFRTDQGKPDDWGSTGNFSLGRPTPLSQVVGGRVRLRLKAATVGMYLAVRRDRWR
jgi:hypothetical protein